MQGQKNIKIQRRLAWPLRKDDTQNRDVFHILGEGSWKAIRDRLRRSYYLSRVDHVRKIMDRKQRTDIGKYSFVNRTIKNWNQLPAEALGTFLVNLHFLERELGKLLQAG